MHFHLLDWIIVVVYLAGTLAAGLYGKRYVAGLSEFLVAGRQLGTFIGAATLAAAVGAVTFFFRVPASYAGLGSFTLAGVARVVGSLLGKSQPPQPTGKTGESPLLPV